MGMAFELISVYGVNPPVQNLVTEGVLSTPMFGFKHASSDSELFLGGVNPDYKEEDFTWVPLSYEVCPIFKYFKGVSNACIALIGVLAGILR